VPLWGEWKEENKLFTLQSSLLTSWQAFFHLKK
jgi:hypothetical protein